jgi:alkylation response protein AidB-like acyl-CoA dehydrogenase
VDLTLSPEDQQLVTAVSSLFQRESTAERVRAAENTGFDRDLWKHLQSLGVPSMAASDSGQPGASLSQLALVAEQAGVALASAPIIEGLVATRLLDRFRPAADHLLDEIDAGTLIPTVSLRRVPSTTTRLVPAGAIAQLVVGLDGDELVAVVGDSQAERTENLGCLPLAYRDLSSGTSTVLAKGDQAIAGFAGATQDWRVLSASQLVGMSAASLELGVDYVKSREVFGAPIGTFQTIAHRLADDATAIDGARLLAYKAAWAIDEGCETAEALASMSWCFAAETALDVTRDCLHYHGGYGFTKEYDIQLYFRRAKAVTLLWGDPRAEYQRLADAILPGGGGHP